MAFAIGPRKRTAVRVGGITCGEDNGIRLRRFQFGRSLFRVDVGWSGRRRWRIWLGSKRLSEQQRLDWRGMARPT